MRSSSRAWAVRASARRRSSSACRSSSMQRLTPGAAVARGAGILFIGSARGLGRPCGAVGLSASGRERRASSYTCRSSRRSCVSRRNSVRASSISRACRAPAPRSGALFDVVRDEEARCCSRADSGWSRACGEGGAVAAARRAWAAISGFDTVGRQGVESRADLVAAAARLRRSPELSLFQRYLIRDGEIDMASGRWCTRSRSASVVAMASPPPGGTVMRPTPSMSIRLAWGEPAALIDVSTSMPAPSIVNAAGAPASGAIAMSGAAAFKPLVETIIGAVDD